MNTWVQYFPGDCGTFISWFINQHTGFLKSKAQLKLHDPVPNEVVCETVTWDWRYHSWQQFSNNRIENYADENIAFKTYTEHNCTNTDDHPDWEMQKFWDTVDSVPNLNSVGLWVPPQHLHIFESRLDHCFNSYQEGDSAATYYANRSEEYEELVHVHQQRFSHVDLHMCDVHALLFDLDQEEYFKLCAFLGVAPCNHWALLTDFYVQQVFNAV